MACEKCGSPNVRIMGNLMVSIPEQWEGGLTRMRMRSKDFEVWGFNWAGAARICRDCGHTKQGTR